MEMYKRRSDFAEMQIRSLLRDLSTKPQKERLRAVAKFQDYIETFLPEVCHFDADFSFVISNCCRYMTMMWTCFLKA
jgi:hypothetical protein